MPSANSIAQLRAHTPYNPRDPVEQILSAYGVPKRTRHALKEGPRDPATINAIIEDVRALRAEERMH